MRAHPLADIFPMLPPDELQALADDIHENGLLNAITVTDWSDPETGELEDVIVEGRNREKACEMAGVEPRYERLNGISVEAFIVANNIRRRHLSKGQQAMAMGMIYPESGGGRGRPNAIAPNNLGLSSELLRQARVVLHASPSILAPAVLSGVKALADAFRECQATERGAVEQERQMTVLRRRAPDLADRVVNEQITQAEAQSILRDREEGEKNIRQTVFQGLRDFARNCEHVANGSRFEDLPNWLEDEDFLQEFRAYFPRGKADFLAKLDPTMLETAFNKVIDLVEHLRGEN